MHDNLVCSHEDGRIVRSRKTVSGLAGLVQQVRNIGFKSSGNTFDIVQPDIVFRALDSTNIAAVESTEFSENFL